MAQFNACLSENFKFSYKLLLNKILSELQSFTVPHNFNPFSSRSTKLISCPPLLPEVCGLHVHLCSKGVLSTVLLKDPIS